MVSSPDPFWSDYAQNVFPKKKEVYRKRQRIEQLFGDLKENFNMVAEGARNIGHVLSVVFGAV